MPLYVESKSEVVGALYRSMTDPRTMRDVSRENVGKRMAILLFEKGKGEVVTAPVIRGELGARFQISGRMTTVEANDTALLLRAGSLAAPMEIIEERTVRDLIPLLKGAQAQGIVEYPLNKIVL